ncbi:MAG: pyrophosphatase PpaX [Bacillaceae bacterium]|nr:pyrophosphatase PpaX [Bacillaceae bacterium]
MKYQTVLFDLDGTLIDTNELILHTFEYTLEKYFPGKYSREDIIAHLGDTLIKQMERFGPEIADELVETYREYNEQIHDDYVREFPGVRVTVEQLHRMGIRMGIVTTKQRRTAEMGVHFIGLRSYMGAFITYQDTRKHKPHPEPILMAMEQLRAEPESTLMVGDSRFDLEAAHNAGIDSVAVSWSLKGIDHLKQYHPTYIIDDMSQLIEIVESGKIGK